MLASMMAVCCLDQSTDRSRSMADDSIFKTLDSGIKKNTAFIKKVKQQITDDNVDVWHDTTRLSGLSLERPIAATTMVEDHSLTHTRRLHSLSGMSRHSVETSHS